MDTFGPYDTEAGARADCAPGQPVPGSTADNRQRLLDACTAAGVDLGNFDRYILKWLAGWEPTTVQVVVGWISRAHAAGVAAGTPDSPFDGWTECPVTGCPSTSDDLAAEDEMDDADGMAHGVRHHHIIDHWVVREADVRDAGKETR